MLVQSIIAYERKFKHQFDIASAYIEGGQRRMIAARTRLVNQRGQLRAIDAALRNLNYHSKYVTHRTHAVHHALRRSFMMLWLHGRSMNDEVTSFMEKYTKQRDAQQSQLDGFESDITQVYHCSYHGIML